jgi:hypothetical protein
LFGGFGWEWKRWELFRSRLRGGEGEDGSEGEGRDASKEEVTPHNQLSRRGEKERREGGQTSNQTAVEGGERMG